MAGGAADKGGNRYEHLWTANRILDLLSHDATRMRLEPPGASGTGIEFIIEHGGLTAGEQVKGASDRWTINRLKNEDVLANALHQIGLGRHFRLIASSEAPQLTKFSQRSRETIGLEEFEETLGSTSVAEFRTLAQIWDISRAEAWVTLRSIRVDHISSEALEEIVRSRLKLLFASDPDLILSEIRSFTDQNLHRWLTGPMIWAHLKRKGFDRRHLVGDTDSINKLHKTVERHQRRTQGSMPLGGFADSPFADELTQVVTAATSKQVTVVDGRAGSGKSTVVASVLGHLESQGWFVAVARMDVVEASATSSERLGDQLGFGPESPAVILAGVSGGAPALLVIDQLDAVTTFSGRIPRVYEAVDELLVELTTTPNVKVIVVVRTVDLQADPRLNRLRHEDSVNRFTIGELSEDAVLARLGPGSDRPTAPTLTLLRTPLHLSIFLRLSPAAQHEAYPSLQELYNKYSEELRARIELQVGHLDWLGITSALVTFMSERERLEAPVSVLDAASPQEWRALESAALLVRNGDQISFFHETYFDYLFARAFLARGQALADFLVESGQHLFRRAQTRQVLTHMASTDIPQFRRTVSGLLASKQIRSHLKEVVVDILGETDPSPESWQAVEAVAWSDDPSAWRLLSLLNRPQWFDAVDSLGKWEPWLQDPTRVELAFHHLRVAASHRPARAVELMTPFIGVSDEWRWRFKSFVEWSLKPGSVDFAAQLIQRGDLDDARGPIAVNSDFWSIVYGLAQDDAAAAAKLMGAYLRRGLARAQAHGSNDPFATGEIPDHSQSDEVIADIARRSPGAFLDEVLPFVLAVALSCQSQSEDGLKAGQRWGYRIFGPPTSVDDRLFEGVEIALIQLVRDDLSRSRVFLDGLRSSESEEMRFLVCRALTASQSSDEAVEWLVGDSRNLGLGWSDNGSWASREFIAAHSARCRVELFERLESMIRAACPRRKNASWNQTRYELLSALDTSRLSLESRRELQESERLHLLPSPPMGIQTGFVGPPIAEMSLSRMSDEDWVRALRKYREDDFAWRGESRFVGGARELSFAIEKRAEIEPDRFAELALQLDVLIPSSAFEGIIRGIAGKVDSEVLSQVCSHAMSIHGSRVGRTVCAAAKVAKPKTRRLLELVTICATDQDPDAEWSTVQPPSGANIGRDDLDIEGMNSTRGAAADAVATALFESAEFRDDLLEPAVVRLVNDPIPAVRARAAESVVAMLNYDEKRAFEFAEALFDSKDDIFDSRCTERLLTYLVLRAPERFGEELGRALDGREGIAERAGRVWAIAALNDRLPRSAPPRVEQLTPGARRGAAEVFASNVGDSMAFLPHLVNDDDDEVQNEVAFALRSAKELSAETLTPFVALFLDSRAFSTHCGDLLHALERLPSFDASMSLLACERAVAVANADLGDIRTDRMRWGRSITRIVLRAYRQGDTGFRSRCLDLIDRLSELNAYGVSEELAEER